MSVGASYASVASSERPSASPGSLACVVNLSTDAPPDASGVLDVHRDGFHNRSVLTIAGPGVWASVCALTRVAVATLDIRTHSGVHPRIGVVDVVPWVDLDALEAPWTARSIEVRDQYAAWARAELGVPTYVYGPERSLPDIRRDPNLERHPTAGAIAVGARGALVAYNLWLACSDLRMARRIAAAIRRPGLRTLGLQVGDNVQVSCNLTTPFQLGPGAVYDLVAAHARIDHAELVGLLPAGVLEAVPKVRWAALDIGPDRTIESRLARVV